MTAIRSDAPILLVDDSMIMRELVQNTLVGLGYTNISAATNGATALEKVQEAKKRGSPYKLMFVDWGMPGMDGYALLKACRADEELNNSAIIMLTSASDQKNMIAALGAGATAYITKPFTPEIIAEKIKDASEWLKGQKQ